MDLKQLAAALTAQGHVTFAVKVIPKSPRNEIVGSMSDGTLKVRVAAAPEKGRANAELCAFLAHEFRVSRGNVAIVAGETAHRKQIRISL